MKGGKTPRDPTRRELLGLAAAAIASAAASATSAVAQTGTAGPAVDAFYRGRHVTLIIPTAPGGINDLAGRLVARHLGRFIGGTPTILV